MNIKPGQKVFIDSPQGLFALKVIKVLEHELVVMVDGAKSYTNAFRISVQNLSSL